MSDPTSAQISEFMDGLRRGTVSSEALAAAMSGSTKDIKDSSTKLSSTFVTGAGQIYGGVTSFTKSMASGAQGASAFSGIITATSTGLTTMLGRLGATGTALGKMAEFAEGYVVQALKQSDDLFTAFQGLSKVGGASEEGMKGVFDNMQKFGMTMNQMPQFGAMIAQNSEALAKLGGSVSQGTKIFAGVASGIQQSGLQAQFERMGLTVQAQNEGTANYLRLQAMNAANSTKSTAELTAGAAEYLRQQDRLSRLTGKSADVLAKEQEARMADQRFRALTREQDQQQAELRAINTEESIAQANAIKAQQNENTILLDNLTGGMKKGAQDLLSGFSDTPEAQQMIRAMPELANTIRSGNFKASEALQKGADEVGTTLTSFSGLAKAGGFDKVLGKFSEYADFEAQQLALRKTGVQSEKTAQDKLAAGSNVDVNNQVALREAQRQTTTALDNLVQIGVAPLTAGLETLATKLAGVVTVLPGAIGTEGKTQLNRTPTEKEAAQGITKEQVARGRYAPATAGFKSKLPDDIDMDTLTATWKTFVSTAVFNLTEETDKKAVTKEPSTIRPPAVLPGPSSTIRPPPRISAANLSMDQVAALRGAGPAYSTPTRLEETRLDNQTSTRSSAADSTTELATVFDSGIKLLSRGQSEQQQTLDELVELMRRSVGVQGKILQTSR